jgi:MGT family glycosyltransferase
MARILITGIPTFGLANPTFGLVAALSAAGHHVDYLMPEAFRPGVERAGAHLVTYADYLHGRPVTNPVQGLAARMLFDEVTRRTIAVGGNYDVVVATGLQPQFQAIQDALDVPVVRFSPIFWQNDRTLAELMAIADALPGFVRHGLADPRLRRLGSQVAGRALLGNQGADVVSMLAPQSRHLNLNVSSRFYQPRADDFDGTCVYLGPTPTVTITADDELVDRVSSHPGPVVYVTLGTVYNGWIGYFRQVIDAFSGSDALVVITAGRTESVARIGTVPDNIIVRAFVPQADLLAHADLYVGHGGFGSITDAALAEVPMIVTPLGGDQFFNAYRLAELDAASVLAPRRVTAERISRLATAALNGRGRPAGLAELAASFRDAGGPALGVARIEALL